MASTTAVMGAERGFAGRARNSDVRLETFGGPSLKRLFRWAPGWVTRSGRSTCGEQGNDPSPSPKFLDHARRLVLESGAGAGSRTPVSCLGSTRDSRYTTPAERKERVSSILAFRQSRNWRRARFGYEPIFRRPPEPNGGGHHETHQTHESRT
jgi:hypothetical protein